MNYYIDFDNTLYETSKMFQEMLNNIKELIFKKNYTEKEVEEFLKKINTSTINFFDFIKEASNNFKIEYKELEKIVLNILLDKGKEYLYYDSIDFLKKLKDKENNIYILTYVEKDNKLQQELKLKGSGILEYITQVIITTKSKATLQIDYENSIFIDDNPKDLTDLYNRGVHRLIRIKRLGNDKKNNINLDFNIEEYTELKNIKL